MAILMEYCNYCKTYTEQWVETSGTRCTKCTNQNPFVDSAKRLAEYFNDIIIQNGYTTHDQVQQYFETKKEELALFISLLPEEIDYLPDGIIKNARDYAIRCHASTNHKYDGKPYFIHLKSAFDYGVKYCYLLPKEAVEKVLASIWVHDVEEDCRETYNDVKEVLGEQIADIVHALTNEKGKTREERANFKYYKGIRDVRYARFVKLCDRLANVKYSVEKKGNMLNKYREEHDRFLVNLFDKEYQPMFEELGNMLKQ